LCGISFLTGIVLVFGSSGLASFLGDAFGFGSAFAFACGGISVDAEALLFPGSSANASL
jgi:hypothetical protein